MAEQAETRSIGDILRQMDQEAEAAGDEVPEEVTPEKAEPAPEPPTETPAEPAPEPEPESVDLDSLADLAAHIGVEVADLYRLKIPLSGDEPPTTLGEWKDRVQALKQAERTSREAAALREQAETMAQARQREWAERIATLDAMVGEQEASLRRAYEGVDWARLRTEDPAEYAARRQEQAEAASRIEGLRERARQGVAAWQQQQAQEQQRQLEQVLAREHEALLASVPEWRDPTKARDGKQQVAKWLADQGFGDAEIAGLVDHRAVLVARKAMLYDEIQRAKPKAQSKVQVRLGSKVLTPSPRQTPDQARDEERREALSTLKKSGSSKDFGKVLRILGV